MILFRWMVLLMALAFVLCMAAFTVTREPVWRVRAMTVLRWGVALGLGFFGLLILRRAAVFI
ncbi:MAG TPA: hypothetical protein H9903_15130 [Candidatus Aquabacterium excrementipullorum]|nr:hypothetical protein [Candidatus Aquabacterium excrementipullorum]